jgi:hypothetical protein
LAVRITGRIGHALAATSAFVAPRIAIAGNAIDNASGGAIGTAKPWEDMRDEKSNSAKSSSRRDS